jgi:outer membrane immunogenic protein
MTHGVYTARRALALAVLALGAPALSITTVAAAEMIDTTETTALETTGQMRAKPKARKPVTMQRAIKHDMEHDIPPPPLEMPIPLGHDWSGFYAGGFVGGMHGVWTLDFYRNNNHGHSVQGLDGLEGGVWAGYNTYLGQNTLAGVEVDLGTGFAKTSNEVFDNDDTEASYNSFGSVRGRLGWVMDKLLVYGTAGLAFANINNQIQKGQNAGEQVVWEGQNKWGWAAGAGAEYALNDRWTTRAEYLFSDFGSVTLTNRDGNTMIYNNQLHQLRLGASYKF